MFPLKLNQGYEATAQMVKDLDIETEVIVCPTVRESDGLAFSSRNRFLSVEERKAAAVGE